jgi:hypothetical protein
MGEHTNALREAALALQRERELERKKRTADNLLENAEEIAEGSSGAASACLGVISPS